MKGGKGDFFEALSSGLLNTPEDVTRGIVAHELAHVSLAHAHRTPEIERQKDERAGVGAPGRELSGDFCLQPFARAGVKNGMESWEYDGTEPPWDEINREIRQLRAERDRVRKAGGLWLSARLGDLEMTRDWWEHRKRLLAAVKERLADSPKAQPE